MSVLDRLNQLKADAMTVFETHVAYPVRKKFFEVGEYGELCCCGLTAAYVKHRGKGEFFATDKLPAREHIVNWATEFYDLSYDAVEGVVLAFDGEAELAENIADLWDDSVGFCTGYSIGKELAKRFLG